MCVRLCLTLNKHHVQNVHWFHLRVATTFPTGLTHLSELQCSSLWNVQGGLGILRKKHKELPSSHKVSLFLFSARGVCKHWRSRHWLWVWLYNERWEIKVDQIYERDKINSFSTWNTHTHTHTIDMFKEWVHVRVWVQGEFPSEFTIRKPRNWSPDINFEFHLFYQQNCIIFIF